LGRFELMYKPPRYLCASAKSCPPSAIAVSISFWASSYLLDLDENQTQIVMDRWRGWVSAFNA
jgi:hypothetical protein